MAVVHGPLICKQAWSLGPPGTLERSNCPWEVRPLLFSFSCCVIFLLLWKLMLELNTLPWFWQALCFLSRWGAEKHGRAGLKDTGQLCSLRRRESTGRRPQQQPHLLPIDFCPIPVPWNQFTRQTCLPTQPECAGKLEWLPGSPPEGSPGAPGRWI